MSDTITKAPLTDVIGKRVKVTACSPQRVVGATGTVKRIYSDTEALQQVYVKLDSTFEQGPHEDGEWIINGWTVLEGIDAVTRDNVVGMTLVAKYVPGFGEFENVEFTVVSVHDDTTSSWTRGLCLKGVFEGYPDGLWVHEWDVPATDEHTAALKAKDDEIARLEKLLEDERGRLRESQRYYAHDLGAINRLANEEADQQDWCSTYEDTLEAMNSVLIGGYTLVGREFEWTVDAYEDVTVRVRRSWSGMARDEESAKEAAGEHFEQNDLSDDDVISALREYADPSSGDLDSSRYWTVEKV
jgi:hypothetical protein